AEVQELAQAAGHADGRAEGEADAGQAGGQGARAARLVPLQPLGRGWTNHNAFLSELRDGIHLRGLGRRDPLDEFNREAVPVFKGFLDDARARAAESFEELEVKDGRLDGSDVGGKGPSMT